VIFARGTWALSAAKNATGSIPIVGIDLESDPIEAGLVASIARPGGNITGLFLDLSELSGKHLQFLKEIMPRASRAAVLGNPDINALQIRELERVAQSLEMQIRAVDVRNATDLDGAFDAAKDWRADALIVFVAYRTRIGDLAEKVGLPSIISLPSTRGRGRSHFLWAGPAGHYQPACSPTRNTRTPGLDSSNRGTSPRVMARRL
jgi:ABC transporter substrate binding protein